MANYSTLKAAVADVVKTNGSQAITGANLQSVLLSIINSIGGGGYIFAGVATPSTSVGTPDQNVFYITGAGTFANMGSTVTIPVGSIGVFKYNGSWNSSSIDIAGKYDAMTGFYTCGTGAGTAAKTVTASGYELTNGGSIKIKFTNTNTSANPTLNINSTGAKPIVFNDALASSDNTWGAGDVIEFYYDSTYDNNAGGWIGRDVSADNTPTAGSRRWVTSDGVKKVAQQLENKINGIFGDGFGESDLDIVDENENALVSFYEGNLKTKYFNSKGVNEEIRRKPSAGDVSSAYDLVIEDNNDNALVIFSGGHIKTKHFNSAQLPFIGSGGGSEISSNILGFNKSPNILSDEYDYILIFAYGQSYTVATDGQYNVTDELDDSLYIFSNVNSTTCDSLSKLNESSSADIENTINSASDIIAKLTRKYTTKSPDYIINNQGIGSRTVLELMKESSIRELLTTEEWDEFSQSAYYENRYGRVTTFLTNLNAWATANNKKILCPFFIYLQGESDTHSGVAGHGSISSCGGDYEEYKERLSIMLEDLKSDIMSATGQVIAPAALIDNIGNGQFNDTLSGISQAQTDVTLELDGVFSCGPYYAYPSYGAHPTPDGRRWIGEALAKTYYNSFIGCRNSSMRIMEDYLIDDNSVTLEITSPCPPLIIDEYTSEPQTNYGFKAFAEDLTEIPIDSVTIKGSQVKVMFNGLPQSDFYISYGSTGYGNVRDSSNWKSCYKYTSNALGNMSSIAHYPKDRNGNDIIGKPYPMWNWMPFGYIKINV